MYNSRTITLEQLINLIIEVKNKICTSSHTVIYWKICAIQELMEMINELPWESWKNGFEPNTHHIKLEIVDVLIFCIQVMMTLGANLCNISSTKYLYCDNKNIPIEKIIFLIIQHIMDIDFNDKRNWSKIEFIINRLCNDIVQFKNEEEFQAYVICKIFLVKHRLNSDGKYHINYNKITKDGMSEEDVIQDVITTYLQSKYMNIDQLILLLENKLIKFIY